MERNYGNTKYELQLDTVYEVSWAGKSEYTMGEVLCEPVCDDGSYDPTGPRYIARKQLDILKSMGYRIWSACELEAVIVHSDTQQPVFKGRDVLVQEVLSINERLLIRMDKDLEKAGVNVATMQTEWGSGQFEWALEPEFGIQMADKTMIFKHAVREICRQQGCQCWFLAKSFEGSGLNGCHFNHSLWNENGKNVFLDEDAKYRFSQLGRYWLGGLIRHGRALCALCAPTVNCYRRFHEPFTPSKISWGFDNRLAAFRVPTINKTSKGPFIENRLGSSSCNPYFILAATVAAGIDGITNAIEPPEPGTADEEDVPHTLAEALDALEQDKVLCEALGEQFIRWFLQVKREIELVELDASDVTKPDEKGMAKERDCYMYL